MLSVTGLFKILSMLTRGEVRDSRARPFHCIESMTVEVNVFDERVSADPIYGSLVAIDDVVTHVLAGERISAGQVDVFLYDPTEMAALNHLHMQSDRPTDVLAFPLDGPMLKAGEMSDSAAGLHVGDIVLCVEVARNQAPEHCGSFDAEITLLIIHGVLHLLGYDHLEDDPRTQMQSREARYMNHFGFQHPVVDAA